MTMNFHELPVYKEKNKILECLESNPVIIVESPTGSGKTTQIPIILHEAGYTQRGVVGITQPRRIAAVNVSEFIAGQLQTTIPGFVGYKMRFEDQTTPTTKIKVMTDGTLLQEIKTDPLLLHYQVLLIDEAHERSLNIDFILGLVKKILKERNDFKVIISSATINTQVFSTYFDDAPIVHINTPTYPVTILHTPPAAMDDEEALVLKVVDILSRSQREGMYGDVLVFLPGEKLIKDTHNTLVTSGYHRWFHIVPLYGRLSKEEQAKVFDPAPEGKHKVVLSTNIAETSVTINGVTIVIDSGLAKINFYNPRTFTSSLQQGKISRASAQQRKGRAGRTQPGVCYRLYSEEDFNSRDLFTLEEIYRTDLSEVVLRMSEIGIRDFESFDFLSPPGKQGIQGAVEALNLLEALNPDHSLSNIGKMMVQFPLLPRHSRMIVEAIMTYPDVVREVIMAATFLSTDSPFLLPVGEEMEARRAHHAFRDPAGDFRSYIKIFDMFNAAPNKEIFCKKSYLDLKGVMELLNIQSQLEDIVTKMGVPLREGGSNQSYLCAVAKGLIQFVCVHTGRGSYRSLTAEKILIHPGSVLFKETPAFIVAGEIVRTSRIYARSVSPLNKDWLNTISPHLFQSLQGNAPRDYGRNEDRGRFAEKAQEKDNPWQIRLGKEVFSLKGGGKGKQKLVVLPWERFAPQLSEKLNLNSETALLRTDIQVKGWAFLTGTKLGKVLEILQYVDPVKDQLTDWPQGRTFQVPHKLELLLPWLDHLMKVSPAKGKGKELGLFTLQTDGQGQYWFRLFKNWQQSLGDNIACLEVLADEDRVQEEPETLKKVNQSYRRLNGML